jgi:hypothetical protein
MDTYSGKYLLMLGRQLHHLPHRTGLGVFTSSTAGRIIGAPSLYDECDEAVGFAQREAPCISTRLYLSMSTQHPNTVRFQPCMQVNPTQGSVRGVCCLRPGWGTAKRLVKFPPLPPTTIPRHPTIAICRSPFCQDSPTPNLNLGAWKPEVVSKHGRRRRNRSLRYASLFTCPLPSRALCDAVTLSWRLTSNSMYRAAWPGQVGQPK